MSRHRRIGWFCRLVGVALAIYAGAVLGGGAPSARPGPGARAGKPKHAPGRGLLEVAPEPLPSRSLAAARPVPPPRNTSPVSTRPVSTRPLSTLSPPHPLAPAPAPRLSPSDAPVSVRAEPVVCWRFRSATSLTGSPAVTPTGLVYAASVEGFLYALGPDGTFRWSFGLSGMPVGAPTVDPAGQVYVATTEQRLYAFKPDGQTSWVQRVGARFASPPQWAAPGFIYFAGRDRNLYSVPAGGGAPQAHGLGLPASGTLTSLGEGAVAVGLEGGDAQLFRRASPLARLELAAGFDHPPLDHPLLGGKAHWYVVTGAGLVALDVVTRARTWAAPARRAGLSPDERTLVLEDGGDLVWREPASGLELHRVQLSGEASSSPLVTNSAVAVVPLMSGALLVVDPKRRQQASVSLGSAPAWPPVWSETSRRVTAAAGGDVVSVDLSDWASPSQADDPPDAGASPSASPDERRGEAARRSGWSVERSARGGG